MIALDLTGIAPRVRHEGGKPEVFDPIRRKWVALTPEEHVRQYVIGYLSGNMRYPTVHIAVEKAIALGKRTKRFDIVVYDRGLNPWMLVECKAPEVPITEQTLHQLLNYQSALRCRYWLLTNGHHTLCADAIHPESIHWLQSLPPYDGVVLGAAHDL